MIETPRTGLIVAAALSLACASTGCRRNAVETAPANSGLAPKVIQQIVRQNFGRFRRCYEAALRDNPTLQGRVVVKFVIDRNGTVARATDAGSDLPDGGVVSCIVRGFSELAFPEPEGRRVTVVYPIVFAPGDP